MTREERNDAISKAMADLTSTINRGQSTAKQDGDATLTMTIKGPGLTPPKCLKAISAFWKLLKAVEDKVMEGSDCDRPRWRMETVTVDGRGVGIRLYDADADRRKGEGR